MKLMCCTILMNWQKLDTMLGSSAMMVFDEDTDVVQLLHRITQILCP